MEKWSEQFNIPLPDCAQCGTCCLLATPSVSYKKLLEKAAAGDQFARDFFSIFIPYKNHEQAEKICESLVKRTIKSCIDGINKIPVEDLVFYRCRHYHYKKQCLIYETRPQLCRDFPGSPFVLLHENCAFYQWAKDCKKAYNKLKEDIQSLKKQKKELEDMKEQKRFEDLLHRLKNLKDNDSRFMLILPSLSVISPCSSWLK
ncbi:MAG TPA: YkgJ family cysteine cluster protein [Candidatus Gastranaerophilales bacterium]|nr:YkgJ family cysteine cluster protein [Candidatus Gastranaerophilales bacterium]